MQTARRELVATVVALGALIALPVVTLSAVWNVAPTTGSTYIDVFATPVQAATVRAVEGDAGGQWLPIAGLSIESWPAEHVRAAVYAPALAFHAMILVALVLVVAVAARAARGRPVGRASVGVLAVLAAVTAAIGFLVPVVNRWGLEQVITAEGLELSHDAAVRAGADFWVHPVADHASGVGFQAAAIAVVLMALLVQHIRSERAQAYL